MIAKSCWQPLVVGTPSLFNDIADCNFLLHSSHFPFLNEMPAGCKGRGTRMKASKENVLNGREPELGLFSLERNMVEAEKLGSNIHT